jgi:hypothetical protein
LPFFQFSKIRIVSSLLSFGDNIAVGDSALQKIKIINQSSDSRKIDSAIVMRHKDQFKIVYISASYLKPSQSDSMEIQWNPKAPGIISDTVLIYHNAVNTVSPVKIVLTGTAVPHAGIHKSTSKQVIKNYPDPFSDYTYISYNADQPAKLIVYNISGSLIEKYDNLNGNGSLRFDGSHLISGIYLYKLITRDNFEFTGKMVLIR